ncbi:Speckle-type POZ protein-like B [Orchesella cincta]|uniref:Speckle-type POZ protein-like B n=1 Tax=Orchesella cincta TaxID=48709 RepID=A0A1D2M6M0_ORCCI|nr:Speckle-type POZ protein-like B [Orchesella cincta]
MNFESIMIPTPRQKQVYLLKDNDCNVFCGKLAENQSPTSNNLLQAGNVRLYHGNKNVKRYPGYQTYDERKLKGISEAVEDSLITIIQVRIEFIILEPSFLARLSKVVSSPKISIRGKFKVPQVDGNRYEFSVSDFAVDKLKLTKCTLESFHGSTKMVELCNQTPQMTHMSLKYSVYLSWSDTPPNTELNVLEKLLNDKIMSDCIIIADNQEEVKCHRSILAAASDVLFAMLTSQLEESQTNRIDMSDVSKDAVDALLAYLYGKKINKEEMPEIIALELFRTAHKYNVEPLENFMREMLLQKSGNWFSINVVLELYFFVVNVEGCEELCDKMLNILKTNSKQLRTAKVPKLEGE